MQCLKACLLLQDFWKFWDVLVWVEATIYQLDNDNEAETGLALKPATPSGAASGEREAGAGAAQHASLGRPTPTTGHACLMHAKSSA